MGEFDLFYQDVQKRIKDHRFSNQDYAHKNKIDIVIVVDMLLTGFDSKYLNTLYVDKNLKYHGLIQAFSRTNRVLNDTKPYGNILDFRSQQNAVDEAIKLFSGKKGEQAKEIWLVEAAPKVIEKLNKAVKDLEGFMATQHLPFAPDSAHKLKGDEARAEFLNKFKEVQRLKTQLDQYTDLTPEQKGAVEKTIPEEDLRGFRGAYLEIAKRFKDQRGKDDSGGLIDQIDFEFVLFSSAIIDYDYIMKLIAQYSQGKSKQKMTRDQLVGLLTANSNLMDERDDIVAYINTLRAGEGLTEEQVRKGFQQFRDQRTKADIAEIAARHGLASDVLYGFVEGILDRMILDGDRLTEMMEPFELGWKDRTKKEEALMNDLIPFLRKLANGREISGLNAYE